MKPAKADLASSLITLIFNHLLHQRSSCFTRTKIAQMLLVSRWTLRCRIVELWSVGYRFLDGFKWATRQSLRTFNERVMNGIDVGTLTLVRRVEIYNLSCCREIPSHFQPLWLLCTLNGHSNLCVAVVAVRNKSRTMLPLLLVEHPKQKRTIKREKHHYSHVWQIHLCQAMMYVRPHYATSCLDQSHNTIS